MRRSIAIYTAMIPQTHQKFPAFPDCRGLGCGAKSGTTTDHWATWDGGGGGWGTNMQPRGTGTGAPAQRWALSYRTSLCSDTAGAPAHSPGQRGSKGDQKTGTVCAMASAFAGEDCHAITGGHTSKANLAAHIQTTRRADTRGIRRV